MLFLWWQFFKSCGPDSSYSNYSSLHIFTFCWCRWGGSPKIQFHLAEHMLSHYRKLNIKSKSLMKSNPGWLELAYIELYILPQTVSNLACAGWVSSRKCNRNIYFWWARLKMFAALNAACLVRRMSSFSVPFMQSYNGIHVKVIW